MVFLFIKVGDILAIETNLARVRQAYNFSQKPNLYFVLGRDQNWANPSSPDSEDVNTTMIENPLALVKVDRVLMCYPSEEAPASTDGDTYVAYKGKRWDVVPYDEVFDSNGNPVHSNATYLCLDGTLGVQKLPMFEFTQVGLVDSPQLASNATSTHEASATEVINWGSLYFYENRVKESYTDTMTKTIRYMIKF